MLLRFQLIFTLTLSYVSHVIVIIIISSLLLSPVPKFMSWQSGVFWHLIKGCLLIIRLMFIIIIIISINGMTLICDMSSKTVMGLHAATDAPTANAVVAIIKIIFVCSCCYHGNGSVRQWNMLSFSQISIAYTSQIHSILQLYIQNILPLSIP